VPLAPLIIASISELSRVCVTKRSARQRITDLRRCGRVRREQKYRDCAAHTWAAFMSTATRASPTLIPLFAASLSGRTSMTRSSVILEPAPQMSGTLPHLAACSHAPAAARECTHSPSLPVLDVLDEKPNPTLLVHVARGRLVHAWRFRRATTVARARSEMPAEQHCRTSPYRMRARTPNLPAAVLPRVPGGHHSLMPL